MSPKSIINISKLLAVLFSLSILSCGKDDEPVNVNNVPKIQAQSFNASEVINNTTVIGKVAATDTDNDALTFSIKTNSNALFEITDSGDISLASGKSLDFETAASHKLSIDVSDGKATANAEVTINVVDINENQAPVFTAQTFTIGENAALETEVGILSATDPDGDTVTYSWDPNGSVIAFQLVNDTNGGRILTADNPGGSLDFETTAQYIISIIASDGELSTQADITINVTNGNDIPVISPQSFTVAEDIDDSVIIGTVVATDQDNDPISLSIINDPDDLFKITPSGNLSLLAGKSLDFETSAQHTITIDVSDGNGTFPSNTITINVTDVDESAGIVSRFAGNINGIAGDIDGDALTQSALYSPSSIARDSQGNIYVINGGYNNVKKIDANGQVSTLNVGSAVANRFTPSGLAVDDDDNLYISDSSNHVIYHWNPSTSTLTDFAGARGQSGFANSSPGNIPAGRFNKPAGIAFDPNGNLIVADAGNHSIRIVGPTGHINTIANTSGQAGFQDSYTVGTFFNNPVDVIVDDNGVVYVADRDNNVIRSITKLNTTNWRTITIAGDTSNQNTGFVDGNGTSARFNQPTALVIDDNGDIYVTDRMNNTIRKVTTNGDVTTLNQSNQNGFVNGTLTNARFDSPNGIETDGGGNFYISDGDNNVIRFVQFPPQQP